jgi:hypothetical protein
MKISRRKTETYNTQKVVTTINVNTHAQTNRNGNIDFHIHSSIRKQH